MSAAVKGMRIIHLAFLVSILLYFLMGEIVGPTEPRDVRTLRQVVTALAVLNGGIAVVLRKRMLQPAREALHTQLDAPTMWRRWMRANLVSFALCESVGLCGLLLRMLGATTLEAAPFYAVAFVLMLVFRPVAP